MPTLPSPDKPTGVRERTRLAIRHELSAAALELFTEIGYDETTVSAIASRVGVSERTFFRYFHSKEGAILEPLEDLGHEAARRLSARPSSEPVLLSLRAALEVVVEETLRRPKQMLAVMLINRSNSALRSRHLQKQDEWVTLLAEPVASRLGVAPDSSAARLPCSIVLAAWDSALSNASRDEELTRIRAEFDAALSSAQILFADVGREWTYEAASQA